jgi:hypothetical protein
MNSEESVLRAFSGRAIPKVKPPWVRGSSGERPHVLKVMPVSGSVKVFGTLFWARADGRTRSIGC